MIICVANQKGGCGKTATSLAMSTLLAMKGYKVLAVDLDPQANLTSQLCPGAENNEHNTYSVLMGDSKLKDAIIRQEYSEDVGIDLVPSSWALSGFEAVTAPDRTYRLMDALEDYDTMGGNSYDFIILDTPPALGTLSINALMVADYCLIPTDPNMDTLSGIWQIASNIAFIKKRCNHKLTVIGILFVMFDGRQNNSKNMYGLAEAIADKLGTSVFKNSVRRAVAVPDSKARQENPFWASKSLPVVQDYMKCVDEFLERIEEGK